MGKEWKYGGDNASVQEIELLYQVPTRFLLSPLAVSARHPLHILKKCIEAVGGGLAGVGDVKYLDTDVEQDLAVPVALRFEDAPQNDKCYRLLQYLRRHEHLKLFLQ